jgi:hypothetical protein
MYHEFIPEDATVNKERHEEVFAIYGRKFA